MIGRWLAWVFALWGAAAAAAPTPPPPAGFAGAQYIDARGCVFRRDGDAWTARLDGQGGPVCGFPPSLDVRRTDADADRALPLTQAPPPSVQDLLMDRLAQDLRTGEWTSDPRMAEVRAEPPPPATPDPVQQTLERALSLAPQMRQVSGLSGSPELCARLGYVADPNAAPGTTLGMCPGMRSDVPLPVATTVRRATPKAAAPASRRPDAVVTPAAPAHQALADRRVAAPKAAPPPLEVEMIPASARYVQVGAYADDQNARIVLRALSQRGYPTGQARRQRDGQVTRLVMAGPFADRQALIAALDDLRRNGYPRAVAR